ncbi:efflux RND transporter permease subunit [Pseudoxanthomonas winnipegensis]|uniref:Efflux RND transporter permease subunit n=1 Tax=Pseudoxanthomonas winnipegensis TaxID=2480810 RepID=A0A4Q9TIV4_9GAMM|nr:efflux RND transporter permease subunit [Pseudoxanthomonas winnipegensis]RZZ87757.1 efflux RND transporter permease subunit [Pseudoxanthomonas winnipegensis]TAA29895.1 efflux RND transporter permease subunit [Pseudoxanthomonas winnipegensis]TBV76297.1 efflux RND transporter permease subunit [Pseudoxanthomonas winnipegensis]TBV78034.1 efflux RND transporter permease subunit [Pseudoxanthomonas winnipegensis]WJI13996.1 efflux RND transporter permease subunit [Pseudoxanthomonas winnipegensis]
MIARIIRASIANRGFVLVAALVLAIAGIWSLSRTPLDALPDLSDTQVIIRTEWPGQTPRIVEDQLTYPLTTTMLSVPGVKAVRGFSFFGDSFVYVLFDDNTDLYWARSRVLEYLSQVRDRLPAQVSPSLGPDATGLGWIYEYALVDRTGKHDLGQLRALQDWFLRYQLKTVPDVAEVASVGGMVQAWQVTPDPLALAARGITIAQLTDAIRDANGATGGSVIEQGEAEVMVRSEGYLRTREDFENVPVATGADDAPVLLRDIASVQRGSALRRGITELDGEGEVAGGVIILRSGKNALAAIDAVKAKLQELKTSLPPGIEIVPTYDRSGLIREAVRNLTHKLGEEFLVVALVCALFLWHLRSSLVAVITLPLGVLAAFVVMHAQGISANLLSLGGIAIAIGAMVDAAVVMIENAHKHLEHFRDAHHREPAGEERWRLIAESASEVGPALFVSLLVITLSFVPVFALQAQEGRLFSPLAYTKTYAMAAAAGLAITLIPVLMGYLVRGRIRSERDNPINRGLIALYRPVLEAVLRFPKVTLLAAGFVLALSLIPLLRLGSEFMPPLEEGTLLYMPTALPGLSAGKAAELLQQTDRMIKTVPEVDHVFGKAGRAETATDPAPLEMFETTVTFKPRSQWRPGMTPEKLRRELDAAVKVPGLTNLWVPPIRNRIDMLATGIKSPIGIKVSGPDVEVLAKLNERIEQVARGVPGVSSALAERIAGGRYLDVKIRPSIAARYGLSQADVQRLIATVVGGDPIAETIQGRERYPVVLRYPRTLRDSPAALAQLPLIASGGAQLTLGQVAELGFSEGPPMLRSDDARLSTYVYVDVAGRDLGSVVGDLQKAVAKEVPMPAGYAVGWSGQYEYLQRARQRLQWVVPATLVIIFGLIFLVFRRASEAAIIMLSLPLALVGGLWLIWAIGHAVSVATLIGFIALAGVAAEFGIIMLLYLRHAWERQLAVNPEAGEAELDAAIREGAVQRVRPKAMTVAVILAGLLPILIGSGGGSEVMQRIAAPMVGGMLSAPLLSMLVIPAAYRLLQRRRLTRQSKPAGHIQ